VRAKVMSILRPLWISHGSIKSASSASKGIAKWSALISFRTPSISLSCCFRTWYGSFMVIFQDLAVLLTSLGAKKGGPSWLTFLGHMEDSLWCWVLVVMDQFTRRIVGFGAVVCHSGRGFTRCCTVGLTVSICFGAS
jgi:hypothetical protein